MEVKKDYISIKIPVLKVKLSRHKRKKKIQYPVADHVSVGSIVMTKNCLDIGYVSEVSEGKPIRILSRYEEYPPYRVGNNAWAEYGGVNAVRWYDTGIKMSLEEWKKLSKKSDASEFYAYWIDLLRIEDWKIE